MAECIHGFEDGLCDSCFPRRAPEPSRSAATRPPSRSAAPRYRPAAAVGSLRSATERTPAASPASPVSFATQRVYHVSHLANLPAILETGEIRPPATAEPGFIPSSATARELRAGIELGGSSLEERVPFSLSPDADRWAELREGAHGVHWSDAARRASIADYVVLVAPLAVLGEGLVLADGDAAAPGTRFADSAEDALRMLRRLHGEGGALTAGEALASAPVAVDRLAIIGVANEPARDRVREMLRSAGLTTKVAVYPPWFQPREA